MSTIYVDSAANGWSHLFIDQKDQSKLHKFAESIGLKKEWFQGGSSAPHYDVKGIMRHRAIRAGAQVVPRKKAVMILVKAWGDYYKDYNEIRKKFKEDNPK